MKKINYFVDNYNNFLVKDNSVFNRKTFYKALPLLAIMGSIFTGIGIITNLFTSINYLFITMNMSFLCFFMYYYYLNLIENIEQDKIKITLLFYGMELIYIQVILFNILLHTLFVRDINPIMELLGYISLILTALPILLLYFFRNVPFNHVDSRTQRLAYIRRKNLRTNNSNPVIQGILIAGLAAVVFIIVSTYLGIRHVGINFTISYFLMMLVVVFLTHFISVVEFDNGMRVMAIFFITILAFASLNSEKHTSYDREEIYYDIAFEKYTGESYENVVNFTETIDITYPEVMKSYALQYAEYMWVEENDYIYLYMTSDTHRSSTTIEGQETTYDNVDPFTYIGIFNKEFEFIDYHFFDSDSFQFYYEDRFFILLNIGIYESEKSSKTWAEYYELDGLNISNTSLFGQEGKYYRFPSNYGLVFEENDMLYKYHLGVSHVYQPHPFYLPEGYVHHYYEESNEISFADGNMLVVVRDNRYAFGLGQQFYDNIRIHRVLLSDDIVLTRNYILTLEDFLSLETNEYTTIETVDIDKVLLEYPVNNNSSDTYKPLYSQKFDGMYTTEDNIYLYNLNQIYMYNYNGELVDYTEIFKAHYDLNQYRIVAIDNYFTLFSYNDAQVRLIDTNNYSDYQFINDYVNVTLLDYSLLLFFLVLSKKSLLY